MTCRLLSAVWRALWKKIKQSVVFNLGNINTSNTEQIYEENSKCVIRFCLRIYLKRLIELQKRFLIAGDSGYPSSKNLVKPYSTAESANDPQKRVFNKRLSGLRTVMSECLCVESLIPYPKKFADKVCSQSENCCGHSCAVQPGPYVGRR